MSGHSLSQISYWDEKAECFEVNMREIRTYAEIVDIGDEVIPDSTKNCPTWFEYVVRNIAKPENQVPVDLYKAYMNLCRVCALGRCICLPGKSNGLSWSLMSETGMVDELCYTCTVFNLKLGLGKLILIGGREFYLEVTGLDDDFEETKTNKELCPFIGCKNHEDLYECKILEGHKLCNHDFDRHLKTVHEIWKLNWSGI
jgi:hypothetical protein